MLTDVLQREDYGLCLSPGFFRIYALVGVLQALNENKCLRAKACSGSSAGALVGGFYASGMEINEMPDRIFSIKRKDIWDVSFGFGLLKGNLLQNILEQNLPVKTFEECKIPMGITAYDILGCRTRLITSGNLATSIRASCCFPGLFQPVMIDSSPHIDGGIFDHCGLMALPYLPPSNLVVNVVCGKNRIASSVLPERFKHARVSKDICKYFPRFNPLIV